MMKEKRDLPGSLSNGFAQRLWNFLKLLERIEARSEEHGGIFDSKAGYTVKLEILDKSISLITKKNEVR